MASIYFVRVIWPLPAAAEDGDDDLEAVFEGYPDEGDDPNEFFMYNTFEELDPKGASLKDYLERVGLSDVAIEDVGCRLRVHPLTVNTHESWATGVDASALTLTKADISEEQGWASVVAELWRGSLKICRIEICFRALDGLSIF